MDFGLVPGDGTHSAFIELMGVKRSIRLVELVPIEGTSQWIRSNRQ
jgi:hypothetical protein